METSAKTSEGVEQTFITAAKMLYKKHLPRIRQAKAKLVEKKNNKLRSKEHGKEANAANRGNQGASCGC